MARVKLVGDVHLDLLGAVHPHVTGLELGGLNAPLRHEGFDPSLHIYLQQMVFRRCLYLRGHLLSLLLQRRPEVSVVEQKVWVRRHRSNVPPEADGSGSTRALLGEGVAR